MKIQLSKEATQKPPEIDDAMETDIRALYKKETGKNPLYKRSGEWLETKAYLKFRDDYLSDLEREIREEEEFTVDEEEAEEVKKAVGFNELIFNEYNLEDNCMKCKQTKDINADTGQCIECDNEDDEAAINYLRENVNLDSRGISTILCKAKDIDKTSLKVLIGEQKAVNNRNTRDAMFYLAIKLGVDLLDKKHYSEGKIGDKIKKYHEEHPEEWEAQQERAKEVKKEQRRKMGFYNTDEVIKEVKMLIALPADGLNNIIDKVKTMSHQDTALSLALLCGALHFMYQFMNNKMEISNEDDVSDEEMDIIRFIMELLGQS